VNLVIFAQKPVAALRLSVIV